MQPILLYGLAVACIFVALLLRAAYEQLRRMTQSPGFLSFMVRHLYRRVIRQNALIPELNRFSILLQSLYWAGTAVFNTVGVASLQEGSARAISIAALNTVPLLLSDRLIEIATLLGIPITAWTDVHRSVGAMTTVQTAVHIALRSRDFGFNLRTSDVYALAALVCAILLGISALPFLRTRMFLITSKLHTLLSFGLVFCLWIRLGQEWTISHLFLVGGCSTYLLSSIRRLVQSLWQNLSLSKGFSRATVQDVGGAQLVTIDVARHLDLNPGQYVYLWAPQLSLRSLFRTYPLTIAWWTDYPTGIVNEIKMLVKPKTAFSRCLERISPMQKFRIVVDGPHGDHIDLDGYSTLIAFASGIGIATLTALIKKAIQDCNSGRNSLQRISVVWEMDEEVQEEWVREWMQELLDSDHRRIIHIQQHVKGTFKETSIAVGHEKRYGQRVKKIYAAIPVDKTWEQELAAALGRTLIIGSTRPDIRYRLHKLSQSLDFTSAWFKETEYQPG